jgi:hypothetical protein
VDCTTPNRFVPVGRWRRPMHPAALLAQLTLCDWLQKFSPHLYPPLSTSTHLPDHHMHASARACAAQPAPTPSERCLAVLACSTDRARPPPLPQSGAFRLPVSALCSVLSCSRRCVVHACPRVSTGYCRAHRLDEALSLSLHLRRVCETVVRDRHQEAAAATDGSEAQRDAERGAAQNAPRGWFEVLWLAVADRASGLLLRLAKVQSAIGLLKTALERSRSDSMR